MSCNLSPSAILKNDWESLKMNPATADQRERSQRDKEPEKDSLKERSGADTKIVETCH